MLYTYVAMRYAVHGKVNAINIFYDCDNINEWRKIIMGGTQNT